MTFAKRTNDKHIKESLRLTRLYNLVVGISDIYHHVLFHAKTRVQYLYLTNSVLSFILFGIEDHNIIG